ncbi:MAG: FtsX-like permease family protein [Anaerolineales bacterium]
MILDARWKKIIKDILNNKSRSLLVILSIAVGVATVGMVYNAGQIIQRDLYTQFRSGNPAHVYMYLSPFPKELASSVESMREVQSAQAARILSAKILNDKKQFEDISLHVYPSEGSIKVNRFTIEQGQYPPRVREIVLERQSAQLLGYKVGDTVEVKLEDGRNFQLVVSGIAHDVYEIPFALMGEATGFISMDTLRWMGEQPTYNRLEVVINGNQTDKATVLDVADKIKTRIVNPAGYMLLSTRIPGVGSNPGDHWAHNQIHGFLLILQIMSVMATLLSGGLVVNTISAIIVQQVKQIGILRAIGGSRKQIVSMYFLNVFIFGVLGLILAIPIGLLGSWGLANFAAHFLNFNVTTIDLPWNVLLLQVGLGLVMPLGVAVFPIMSGTRISVYEAIYQYGLTNMKKVGRLEQLLSRIHLLNPQVILSLRNTFRKKSRLAFTLATLTLAGAMFIASFSTYSSLNAQIQDVERYVAFDVMLPIPGGASRATVEREALRTDGVAYAEGWSLSEGVIVKADGSESQGIQIVGLPLDSRTIRPNLLSGSWLSGDGSAQQIVVNQDLINDEGDIRVGDVLMLKVGDHKQNFTVVGIVSKHLSGARIYMSPSAFSRLTGRHNVVDMVRVLAAPNKLSDRQTQEKLATRLEERFSNAGISKESSTTRYSFFSEFTKVFNIILFVLLIMAGLLAIVGSLGLTGSLGINVLERTREIGVLRAIGAANQAVVKIVLLEGMVVSIVSGLLGGITSLFSSPILAGVVIYAVLKTGMNFRYSFWGLIIWFCVVLVIGTFASLIPARRAALLQVREVLDYE